MEPPLPAARALIGAGANALRGALEVNPEVYRESIVPARCGPDTRLEREGRKEAMSRTPITRIATTTGTPRMPSIRIPRSEWGNQAQWAVTAPLLAASLVGVSGALAAALALCAVSAVYYVVRLGGVRPYRVQVRLGFLAVLLLSMVPGLEVLRWVPVAGTSAQVLFGYCPMARILDLMPWNRRTPLTWRGVREVVTRPPGDEGLLAGVLARR
jgi:hypothetical protein